ncbi:MAG: HAMP domain-containing histidine kinase [Sandaracinaceae bacterium]|nr:HAMP domain-containing histidine kinase [Sandaracinaceae bacterium]
MTQAPDAPRLPLAVRLLALGVVQLCVLGLAALGIGAATRPPPPHDLTGRLDETVSRIEPMLLHDDTSELDRTLETLAREHGLAFTLYGPRHEVIASSCEPPLPFPRGPRRDDRPPGPRPRLEDRPEAPPFPPGPPPFGPPGPRLGEPPREPPPFGPPELIDGPRPPIVRWLRGGHALVARGEPPPGYVGPLLTALVGLLVIAAGAFLTARWIVQPLEIIARTAQAMGQGDLGARTKLERADEIGTVARGFDRMAERVEDMVRSERELLANVSHELRTPLARLRVALDLAAEGHTDALADVTADLQELEGIVDDVLLAFRFEKDKRAGRSGLPVGTLRETTIDELVSAIQRRFSARHPERALELDVAPELPNVLADASVLRRAIDNLLDNAHKYSPDPRTPITLRARASGSRVELVVIDRGMGIEAADLPRIFEPFFRAERSRVRTAGGVGLGLALSRRIVEAHGGTIEASSEVGVGTTMTVRLEAIALPGRTTKSDT